MAGYAVSFLHVGELALWSGVEYGFLCCWFVRLAASFARLSRFLDKAVTTLLLTSMLSLVPVNKLKYVTSQQTSTKSAKPLMQLPAGSTDGCCGSRPRA